jgi:2-keto-4-pentenoate hydratase/2-oxohepta-3-ene-1,7-dioic acid hydratase in catechol pathway
MKFATFKIGGSQGLGVVLGDEIADVTDAAPTMMALIKGGPKATERIQGLMNKAQRYRLDQINLLAPIPRPNKNILCLALNYKDHISEGMKAGTRDTDDAPKYPVWFTKAVTSVCGPFDDIIIEPAVSVQYDWEVELAVVIGKKGRHIPQEKAFDYVHSYTVLNDFSVRDIQRRHGPPPQWFKGKSFDKASPMGPWLVTADELGSPPNVQLRCSINGVLKQNAHTAQMIFDIPTLISDISEVMTLEPGDIISTGTPSGVGYARKPPEFLKNGDLMETEIEGVGTLRNRIVTEG